MVEKPSYKNIVIVSLIVLFVLQLVTVGLLYCANHSLRQRMSAVEESTGQFYNELDASAQRQALEPLPGKDLLYLAELNITVPFTDTLRSVRYYGAADGKSDIRISTTNMTDHSVHTQSCSDMVRLKIEPKPDAYSPSQPLYASVVLADGRILQIYASTIKDCQLAWQNTSPQAIAEGFKSAQSY